METGPIPARRQLQQQNSSNSHLFRSRVANACDICKIRKIKCSGTKPCAYCAKKGLTGEDCRYSAPRGRARDRRSQYGGKVPVGGGGLGSIDAAAAAGVSADSLSGNGNGIGSGSGSGSGQGNVSTASPGVVSPLSQQHRQRELHVPSPRNGQQQHVGQQQGRGKKRRRRSSFRTITTTPREEDEGSDENEEDGSGNEIENEDHEPDDTEVPRDARLVRDPQGKLIFIGDCAPLSFFQTVRRLVTSRVDVNAFSDGHGLHGHSGLESSGGAVTTGSGIRIGGGAGSSSSPPLINLESIPAAVEGYFQVTSGLVDLFEEEDDDDEEDNGEHSSRLEENIVTWARSVTNGTGTGTVAADATSAVNYLVLAIGHQALLHRPSDQTEIDPSQTYFEYARTLAFADLSGNFGIGSLQGVQVHILIAAYMLLAHQTNTNGANGAFLFFGIAARAAYSIGIHRTEINARFGEKIQRQRERIWRSIRVVDLFLSTSMGRPPAASDVDCTVGYHYRDDDGKRLNLLNASVQILLITERIVLQVYSRRKISVRLTEGISRELRGWSLRWLGALKGVVDGGDNGGRKRRNNVNGACQVLASYYYAVILVSRPFLMVELHHRLAGSSGSGISGDDGNTLGGNGNGNGNGNGLVSGRTKLADACIDAAVLMVSPVQDLIARGEMARRAPVVVSWLFAASLVLGLGLLGGFGRVIEKHCRASIVALEFFAESDAHALQYSVIAKSLLTTALEYLERRETMERLRRTESSAKIFGLLPRERESISRQGEAQDSANSTGSHIVRTGAAVAGSENVIFAADSGTGMAKSQSHDMQQQQRYLEQDVLVSPPQQRMNVNANADFQFASSFLELGGNSGENVLPRTPEFSSLMGVSMDDADDTFGALNLFPLLDSDGIDLANLF